MIDLYKMEDHFQMSLTNKDRLFTCLCFSRLVLYSCKFVSEVAEVCMCLLLLERCNLNELKTVVSLKYGLEEWGGMQRS